MQTIPGIHHVTAVTGDAQANIDFYCGVLGLRFVKLTVNFDDPQSYHLYYGDDQGRPGTIMTFFAWPGGRRGQIGPPQVTATAFAVPEHSLAYWASRLKSSGIGQEQIQSRMGEQFIRLSDPDGMNIEIVATKQSINIKNRKTGQVPPEHAIIGFHSVTISEEGYESTAKLLTSIMGFEEIGSEGNRFRYLAAHGDFAATVDLICAPDAQRGRAGTGIVHHVAFRTPDESQQLEWRNTLVKAGHNVSPVMDRNYFQSIYFREPGAVLFEIATDSPGFTFDETQESLGSALKLPAQYEAHREALQEILPKLKLPKW